MEPSRKMIMRLLLLAFAVAVLLSRVGKTAALQAEARIGMSYLRKLDGILSQLYKNNVELLTAWIAAKRQQQPMPDDEVTAPAPGTGSGEGGQPA